MTEGVGCLVTGVVDLFSLVTPGLVDLFSLVTRVVDLFSLVTGVG